MISFFEHVIIGLAFYYFMEWVMSIADVSGKLEHALRTVLITSVILFIIYGLLLPTL